jgi:Ca-activated chloride channel family protein
VRTQQAATPVNQPLPLPQGVSALAVGGGAAQQLAAVVPSTPEPRWALALALTLLLVMAALWRRPHLD